MEEAQVFSYIHANTIKDEYKSDTLGESDVIQYNNFSL